jgi:putative PIN family toxin of toxin-antitoxin system
MRVVIDTNVFIGACLGTGAASAVVASCFDGLCVPLMGTALLTEYEDVLGRGDLFESSRLDGREREELLDVFLSCCEWIRVYCLRRPSLRDEVDNHLVELAVAGAAECIVTFNLGDVRPMELRFPALRVLSPEGFMKEMRG